MDIDINILNNIKDYDCGYINTFGGGDVEWWKDYIRAEIERCNNHWRNEINYLIEYQD